MTFMNAPRCLFLLLLSLILPAGLLAQQPGPIKAGDYLSVEIKRSGAPAKAGDVRILVVSDAGKIKLAEPPRELPASGLTCARLSSSIAKALSGEKEIREVKVTFPVSVCCPHIFTVAGKVGMPGEFPLRQGTTLDSAITRCGGFLKQAAASRVKLIHADGTQAVYDLRKVKKDGTSNPIIRDGDQIIVP